MKKKNTVGTSICKSRYHSIMITTTTTATRLILVRFCIKYYTDMLPFKMHYHRRVHGYKYIFIRLTGGNYN